MGAGGTAGSYANPPTELSVPNDSDWHEMVPSWESDATAKKNYGHRRFTGGTVRNTDSVARTIELRLHTSATDTVFDSVEIPAGEQAVYTDEADGRDLGPSQSVQLQVTVAPTADTVIAVMNYRDEK